MNNSNNFFQLVAEFQKNIDWLNQILKGGESDTVSIDGQIKPSITKDIADHWADIHAMVQGRQAFETKAEMDVSGSPPSGFGLSEVWNDSTAANNGVYGWDGSTWLKSKYDSFTILANDINQLNHEMIKTLSSLGLNYAPESNLAGLKLAFAITGEDSAVAMGVGEDGSLLMGMAQHQTVKELETEYSWGIVDRAGNLPFGITKHGDVDLPGYRVTAKVNGLNVLTWMATNGGNGSLSSQKTEYAWALTDSHDQVALGVEKNGSARLGNTSFESVAGLPGYSFGIADSKGNAILLFSDKGECDFSPSGRLIERIRDKILPDVEPEPDNIPAEINHNLTYGQSLSMGDQGTPVMTISQPYLNLTFFGGVRAGTYAENIADPYQSFKPLIESKATNFGGVGETICSTSCNYVTQLINDEDGISHTDQHYDLLGSTSGKGATTVAELSKGTEPFQWLVDAVTNAFSLSQADGKTYAVQAINWIQGESDYLSQTSSGAWKEAVEALYGDICSEVKLITEQEFNPHYIMYQIASHKKYGRQLDRLPYLAIETLNMSEQHEKMHLSTPMYCIPYSPDYGHLSPLGYVMLGCYQARVYKRAIVDNKAWRPVSPTSVVRQGRILDVQFHVPNPPLAFDSTWITPLEDGAKGFSVWDYMTNSKIPISSVEIIGQDRVKIVLSGDVSSNTTLRYAFGEDIPNGNYSGRDIGPRGQLRDSAGDNYKFTAPDGTVLDLHNYCVIFEEKL